MNFYNIFLRLCNKANKTPTKVVGELGLSNATATGWKNGKQPNDANLLKIADYFNVTVDYLLGKEEKKEPIKNDRFAHDYYLLDEEDRLTVDTLISSLLSRDKYISAKDVG